jgi:hypothetical protein
MQFMEVRHSIITALLAVAVGFGVTLSAQEKTEDGPSAVEVAKRADEFREIKQIANRAALPSLRGEDKFILRESYWNGTLKPGKAKLIQVQLFRRNEYKFWFAAPERDAELALNIYDSEGQLLEADTGPVQDRPNVVTLTFEPKLTGVYYLRIASKATTKRPQDWAVIYAYR